MDFVSRCTWNMTRMTARGVTSVDSEDADAADEEPGVPTPCYVILRTISYTTTSQCGRDT